MKKIITLSELLKIIIPIATIVTLVVVMSSCKTRSASCEAYGQNNIEYGDISEDEAG